MTVSCPDCRSIFRVDPAKVPATGVRARCSVCGGILLVSGGTAPIRTPARTPVPAVPATMTPSASPASAEPFRPASAAPAPTAQPTPVGVPFVAPFAPRTTAPSVPSVDVAAAGPFRPAAAATPVQAPTPVTPTPAIATPAPTATPVRPATPLRTTPLRGTPATPGAITPRMATPSAAPGGAARLTPQFATPIGSTPPATPTPRSATPIAPTPVVPTPSSPTPVASVGATPSPTPISLAPVPIAVGTGLVPGMQGGALAARPTPVGASGEPTMRRPINPFLNADPSQRARRLARALVSDLVAYNPRKRDEGMAQGTLRQLFREDIKKSYEEYVEQVGKELADSTPYFQEALNDILAGGQRLF